MDRRSQHHFEVQPAGEGQTSASPVLGHLATGIHREEARNVCEEEEEEEVEEEERCVCEKANKG